MAKRKKTVIAASGELQKFNDTVFMQALLKLQDAGIISIDEGFNQQDYEKILDTVSGNIANWIEDSCTDEQIDEFIEWVKRKEREQQEETAPTTVYPETFTMSLANAVTSLATVEAPITRDVREAAKFPAGNDVSVYVQLGFDAETAKENGITIPSRITDFDLEVLNAIISLMNAGNRLFWPEQIASVLKGKKAIETATHEAELNRIIAAVERLRFTSVYIDATEQFGNLKYKADPSRVNNGHVVYDENILYLRGARAINLQNGKTVRAWEYAGNKMPVLYEYSQRLKQIASVDLRLLDTGVRTDETITVAKTYMLREISKMKRGSRNNTKMLYSTILKACGIEKPEDDSEKAKDAFRKRKKRFTTDYLVKFCDSWKAQGFISGYEMLEDGIRIEV